MDIKDQRKAIYNAETAIEETLDLFRKETGLNIDTIGIQTLLDDDMNEAPAFKVNVTISKLRK